MHNHNKSTSSNFLLRHMTILIVAIALLGGLYLASRNITSVTVGAVLIVLAHVAAVAGLLLGGRRIVRTFIARLHGTSQTSAHLETDGVTISWARFYDVFVRFLLLGQQKRFIQSILNLAKIQADEKVLDVGCGTGTLALAAKHQAPASATMHGLDAAPEMIAQARRKATAANVEVDFQANLVEAIHFPDGSFDLVMNSLMVHHLPGELKARAFSEMYRVLKPGGRLLIVDFEPPKRGIGKALLRMILGQMTDIDNSIIPALLQEAGFTGITSGPTGSRLSTYVAAIKPELT